MSGILAAAIGMMCVRTEEKATQDDLLTTLRFAMGVSSFLNIGFMAIIVYVLNLPWQLFGCIIIGLVAGTLISRGAEYYTSFAHRPTLGIFESGTFGPANVIIEGLSVGSFSTIVPVIVVASTILAVYALAGDVYGIALASTGMLSTLGITLATDAYGACACVG